MTNEHDESYSHILKYTGVFGGVQGLNLMIGLVRNKFVALLLGPGGMGLASLLNSVQGFVSQSTNLGISSSAIPRLSETYERQDHEELCHQIQIVRMWSLIAAIFGFVLCIVISPLLNKLTFSWGNHTLHYALLAPSVAMLAITGGETAIMKATRRLSSLAKVQVVSAIASLFITIPLYYYFWQAAIVPVIVLTSFVVMVATLFYSLRFFPLKQNLSRKMTILSEGSGLVKLGMAFIIGGAFMQAAEVIIRSVMNNSAELDVVGFYNAGYSLTVYYAAIVLSSIESDFFPRLSAISDDQSKMNTAINQEIEVLLLMISPMLVGLMVFLPVLVPLFYTSEFAVVIPMAQVSVFAMYMKSISLPVCYITLAKKDSRSYLLLELLYCIYFVTLVLVGFHLWGLLGTGIALAAAHTIEVVVATVYGHFRYHYKMTSTVIRYIVIQLSVGVLTYLVTCMLDGVAYWLVGVLLVAANMAFSLYVLYQKTSLWPKLSDKVKSKFSRK